MSSDRWRQVSNLYHAALSRDVHERAAFLDDACPGDEALRREVESLLDCEAQAKAFLQAPAMELAAGMLGRDSDPSRLKGQLGSYRILSLLGAGGMGQVYRAHDTKLRRDVALKVLPRELADEPERRKRLLREARAAASLNHPNICTVHDVGEADGEVYIAMELVEGHPLSARVSEASLQPAEVLRCGLQLAEALGHAHERGVVHRDFKSANVMITPEGRAKVLDFGLAQRVSGEDSAQATTGSRASLAQPGVLIGTLSYMAPEQLRGQAADMRSDVWALGVVLYEMAAGSRPFEGQTTFEVSSAILSQAPPPLPTRTPIHLKPVIERCLEKEPARRYQRASEVRAVLEAMQTSAVTPWMMRWPYQFDRRRRLVLTGTSLVALLGLLVVAALNFGTLRTPLSEGVSAPRIESLAVLPLANLMGGEDQDYYVAAMHEALIAELGQINALSVISRTSVMRYRDTDKSAPEIARELNVEALVEGSMFKAGDNVRIQVQLVRAVPVERQLWSRTYDGELQNVMALQKTVARAIAEQIHVTMTPEEVARLAPSRAVDPIAYDAWAKGWFQFNRLTEESLRKCLEYAAAALAVDSRYAPAYALIAACQSTLPLIAAVVPNDAFPKAAAAAHRALELDDGLAEAHFALGWTLATYDWNWVAAEREFRRGLELNPSSAVGHAQFGWFLSWIGRETDALAEVSRGQQLNPASPREIQNVAVVHFVARRYDDAILAAQRAVEISPTYAFGYDRLGRAYTEKGMYEQAIAALEMAVQSGNVNHKGPLGRAYALAGRRSEARRILDELLTVYRVSHTNPVQIAMIYTALGERNEAVRWLEEGHRVHDGNMVLLKVLPAWDSLRGDPHFKDLLQRMNFP
jgi:serine/threonine-protein kinase